MYEYEKTKNKFYFVYGMIALLVFVSLKEEFALLASGYLTILFVLYRKKVYFFSMVAVYAITGWIFYFIQLNHTHFNRGNEGFVNKIKALFLKGSVVENFTELLDKSPSDFNAVIFSFCLFLLFTIILTRKIHPLTVAFVSLGFAKAFLSYIVKDFALETWHNVSIVSFFSIAIIIQIINCDKVFVRRSIVFLALIFNMYLFFPAQLNFYSSTETFISRYKINKWKEDILELKKLVDKDKVTAIPCSPVYTAKEWKDGYRFSFFPRGVYWDPTGIADYIVMFKARYPDPEIPSCYAITHENTSFLLLERFPPCSENGDRQIFIDRLGASAISPR